MSDPDVPIRIIVGAQNAHEIITALMEMSGYGINFRAASVSSVEELNAFLAAEGCVRVVVIDYFLCKDVPVSFDFEQNPPRRLPGRLASLKDSGTREVIGVSTMEPYLADMKDDGCSHVCKPTELTAILGNMVA